MEFDCDRCEDGTAHVAMWDDDILCGRIDVICENCYESGERIHRPIEPPYNEDGELYYHLKWADCPHCGGEHVVKISDNMSICPMTYESFDVPMELPDVEGERAEPGDENVTQVTENLYIEDGMLESSPPLFGLETDESGYVRRSNCGKYITEYGFPVHIDNMEPQDLNKHVDFGEEDNNNRVAVVAATVFMLVLYAVWKRLK